MPLTYHEAYEQAGKTRKRALNLVEQVTTALLADEEDDTLGAEQVKQINNAINAGTAGVIYLGDSLRQIAAAIHDTRPGA